MSGRFWRAFVVVGLVLGGFGYGCGRTSLDDGFGPMDGAATGSGGSASGGSGSGGSGAGGSGVSGQGGIGPGSILSCGTSACLVGAQACCTPIDLSGRMTAPPYCIENSDPQGCNGAVVCNGDVLCPKMTPHCCILLQQANVGACFPAGIPCPALRP